MDLSRNFAKRAQLSSEKGGIIDLLKTSPSQRSFCERVAILGLSEPLAKKALGQDSGSGPNSALRLSRLEEKELATEVLLRRHSFTRLVFQHRFFRQAALTIIQNIYLFQQRRIFFGTTENFGETERRQALHLFSRSPDEETIPLAKSFQHPMVARIWDRILNTADRPLLRSDAFSELHEIVEQLNTLRNIYMTLSLGLVRRLTRRINDVYRQSITDEDAAQIGSFGIARAAYRYHPSLRLRFSTYASYWILREVQRQALEGRLIKISSNLVEELSRDAKKTESTQSTAALRKLHRATPRIDCRSADLFSPGNRDNQPEHILERREMAVILSRLIDRELSGKAADVLRRRYGLGPFHGREQSVVEIATLYGVSRSSIYQLEQTALRRLAKAFEPQPAAT